MSIAHSEHVATPWNPAPNAPPNLPCPGSCPPPSQADTSVGEALMFDDQGFVSVLVRDGVLTLYYWTASSPDPVAVINLPAAA